MDPKIFARDGCYLMLALDHRGSFKKFLNRDTPDAVNSQDLIARKREVISALGSEPSGILLDLEYGIYALRGLADVPPLLFAMEESGYEEEGNDRHTKVIHMASTIRSKGGSGAKLLLYMHGDGGEGDLAQCIVAREALHNARIYALPFFLEVVIYGAGRKEIGARTLRAMQMLKSEDVEPAVWKLEFPGPELCAEVTKAAGAVPWILLSRGVTFEQFKSEVAIASKAGAKGFLVGRSLWQDAVSAGDAERPLLLSALKDRFRTLSAAMVD